MGAITLSPLAAWLGLVPRQATTSDKPKLLGITKRGSKYLRKLIIRAGHGNTGDDRGHAHTVQVPLASAPLDIQRKRYHNRCSVRLPLSRLRLTQLSGTEATGACRGGDHIERTVCAISLAFFKVALDARHLIGHMRKAQQWTALRTGKGIKRGCFHLDG